MTYGELDPRLSDAMHVVAAIACDWNGTTLNDLERAHQATNVILKTRNFPDQTIDEFREMFRLPLTDYFRSLGVSSHDVEQAITDWNAALFNGPISLSAGFDVLLDVAEHAGIPVGVVSAATPALIHADAEALGIADRLSFIVGNAAVKSAALRELASRFNGDILYCGDTEYDITEALAAGAIAIGFSAGYRPGDALLCANPLTVIDDFTMLARALQCTPTCGDFE